MPEFLRYDQKQAWLLPPSVQDVLGKGHLCFLIDGAVEKLDLGRFRQEYGEEGRRAYAPELMLKVWLYGYALGMTSSRRLEQRVREDLAFRYLAGGAEPDHWTLNAFRKRHARGLNDVFTQVLEWARQQGLGKLGYVAIDSTRVAANASRDHLKIASQLRRERARLRRKIREWQKECNREQGEEGVGGAVAGMEGMEERLKEIAPQLEQLRKTGQTKISETDPDSRFLRQRGGFVLGYSGEVAVSEDHVIVAQRVTQAAADNGSLLPMVEEVQKQCGGLPQRVGADAGFFSEQNLAELEARNIDGYVPDSNLAREFNGGGRVRGKAGDDRLRDPRHRKMREKLRSPEGRWQYQRRKQTVEAVFGVLKEQRGLRRFRRRGLAAVAVEFTLACTAYNLTRVYHARAARPQTPSAQPESP